MWCLCAFFGRTQNNQMDFPECVFVCAHYTSFTIIHRNRIRLSDECDETINKLWIYFNKRWELEIQFCNSFRHFDKSTQILLLALIWCRYHSPFIIIIIDECLNKHQMNEAYKLFSVRKPIELNKKWKWIKTEYLFSYLFIYKHLKWRS